MRQGKRRRWQNGKCSQSSKNAKLCVYIFIIWVTLIGSAVLAAQEQPSFPSLKDASLIMRLKSMREAEAPFVHGNQLLFTYKGEPDTRLVGIAFEAEGFSQVNFLVRNAHNVFIYAISNQDMVSDGLGYRYWVDGLWHQDPENPSYYLDSHQTPISLLSSPSDKPRENPISVDGGYDFYAYFDPGQQVSLLGNFNNWDPFLYPLEEVESGKYHIRIASLRPGKYQYYFWVSGSKHLDPQNYRVGVNFYGEEVSLFTVAPNSQIP